MLALTDYPGRLVVVCPQFDCPWNSHRWSRWMPDVCVNGSIGVPLTRPATRLPPLAGHDVNFGHPDGHRMIERVYNIGAGHSIVVRFKLGYGPEVNVLKAQADWWKPDPGMSEFPCSMTLMVVGDGPAVGQKYEDWLATCPVKVWNSTWRGIHTEGYAFEMKTGYPLPTDCD